MTHEDRIYLTLLTAMICMSGAGGKLAIIAGTVALLLAVVGAWPENEDDNI